MHANVSLFAMACQVRQLEELRDAVDNSPWIQYFSHALLLGIL